MKKLIIYFIHYMIIGIFKKYISNYPKDNVFFVIVIDK